MMDEFSAALASLNIPLFTAVAVFLDQYAYLLFLGIAAAFYLLRPSVRKNKLKLAAFLISLLVMAILVVAVKAGTQQPRPCIVPSDYLKLPYCPFDYSFPSGHTAFAFTFAGASLGTGVFPVFFLLAIITALSRIYLGVHTINDVAGGIVLALATYFIIEGWLRHFFPRLLHVREEHFEKQKRGGFALELRRQAAHAAFGMGILLLIWFVGRPGTELLLVLALFLGMAAMHLRMERRRTALIDELFDLLERPKVMPAKGAFMYVLGALLVLSALSDPVKAMAAIAVLAWGDAAATLAGRMNGGKTRLFYNSGKSWAGAAAFFALGSLAAYPFIGLAALPLAFVCALAETLNVGVDDNFLIPLAALAFFLL